MYSFTAFHRLPADILPPQDALASSWGIGIALSLPLSREEYEPEALCLGGGTYSTNQKRLDFQ